MKIFKMIAIVLITVFTFSAVGFCEFSPPACDDDQQCGSNCNLACCGDVLLPVVLINMPSFSSAKVFCYSIVPNHKLFVSGIEYPPNF